MRKKCKKILTNKPWKQWKTRKFTFIYCLIMGTMAIIFGAIMIFMGKFDTSTWLSETLIFAKFIVGTGTIIIIAPDFVQLVKALKGVDINMEEEDV